MKLPVAQNTAYTIYYERYDDKTFTHADVHEWNKDIRTKFIATHTVLHALHGEPFYALVDNKKLAKFVYLLGYRPHKQVRCNDNKVRTIWIYSGELNG